MLKNVCFVNSYRAYQDLKNPIEAARNLEVTTSAIFNMLKRKNDKFN